VESDFICQGRSVSAAELDWLRSALASHPDWSRKRLARELCQRWQWRTGQGRMKDLAVRSLLLKLEARGLLALPPLRPQHRTGRWEPKSSRGEPLAIPARLEEPLARLQPLRWILPLAGSSQEGRFHDYLRQHHYLGLRVVGENLKYLVQAQDGQDVACLLFGAAAWQTGARDRFVGWTPVQRAGGLSHLVNNTRFLILPWVKVAGLASQVLSRTVRRLSADWQQKYGHPVFLAETFVERDRFAGTSYRAANWRLVGQTQGRGRQGPDPRLRTTSIKDVWVYPLHRHFRHRLQRVATQPLERELV
jgi:hypothetical protein